MNGELRHFFEFDNFRIEVEERRLLRDGNVVTLTPKVFDILLALVGNSGHTVDKNDLMQMVWEDTFVEEGNLNRHISTLRRILGDDPRNQRFIKTIPKRGYRFTAGVKEVVESDETLAVENVSRSRVVIREETTEGFWTTPRMAIAAVLLVGTALLGILTLSSSGSKARTRWTSVPEAADAYTRGRALWQTRKAGDLHEATLLLEQAIQKDPGFALAHAALADAYAFDYLNWKKAESQAREAIRLDPNLGEPHATLGFLKTFWQWELDEAEADFKQAVALSPNYATGHQWYAAYLAATSRNNAALVEIQKAIELEPLSPAINSDYCQQLYFAKRFDEALAQCRRTLEIDPLIFSAHQHLYDIYSARGMSDEAVGKFIENEDLRNHNLVAEVGDTLRRAYANGGAKGFHLAQAEIFLRTPAYYHAAQAFARLGETDKTLNALAKAYESREFDLVFLAADPVFSNLLTNERLDSLADELLRRPGKNRDEDKF